MAFTKVDKTVEELNVHSNLSRTPNASDNLDYKELQGKWDSTGQYIADKINSLIDELEGVNSAPSLGIFPDERFVESGTPLTTVQQVLGFLYEQIQNATIGGLVENSIGYQYLRKAAGEEAVTTETIRNLAVTTAKIANAAITATKIAMNAITSEKIADGAVTTDKLPNGAVSTEKLANGSVATEKLSNSSVTNEKIKNGTIDLATKTTNKLSLQNGGTGADNAADARTNLGVTRENLGVTEQGKIKIGNNLYTLRTGDYSSGAAGYLTLSTS